MIKRSELKEDMYVKIQANYDNSFWSRLMRGRYMSVSSPDKSPDDAVAWRHSYGCVVFYGMGYQKGVSNDHMEPVSIGEADIIKRIHEKKKDYPEIHKLGRKIYRTIEALEVLLRDDLELRETDLWDVSDAKHLKSQIADELSCSDDDIRNHKDIVDEIMTTFEELEKMLVKLSQLEDAVVRGIKPISNTSTWLLEKVQEDGSLKEFAKISGPVENALEIFGFLNREKNNQTGEMAFKMTVAE